MAGRVIVGVNRSVAGLRALRVAVTRARDLGLELWAVRTWETDIGYGDLALQRAQHARLRAEQHIVDAFADIAGGVPEALPVRSIATFGHPGPELVRMARRDDDLLVVGRGTRRRWTPSVAGYCTRHAGCPVLVVPPDALGRECSRLGGARVRRRDLDEWLTVINRRPQA